ncbi:MAG: YbhB/YbcL family Raf kinase inhibitor-like protein [Candidatus Limnocylindria bacterium]
MPPTARFRHRLPIFLAALVVLAGCQSGEPTTSRPPVSGGVLTLSSSAFGEGSAIPVRFTCDDADVSPPLAWSAVPDGTRAFALIVDDPDAGGFVHWLVADLPAETSELAADASVDGFEGRTGFGASGYGGPCPPSGTHRYFFTLFALSQPTGLSAGFDADALRAAMEGLVLDSATLTGTYARGG